MGAPGAESEINIGTNQPLTLTEANALTFTIDKDKVNQRIQINARAVGTDMTWLPIGDIAAALPPNHFYEHRDVHFECSRGYER